MLKINFKIFFQILLIIFIILSLIYFWPFILLILGLYGLIKIENVFFTFKLYYFSKITQIDQMTGIEFENRMFNYFKRNGYNVEKTKTSNDFGADLILSKNNEITVVQTKRWLKQVGISAVQEICAAIKYYHAQQGMLITNSKLTNSAKKLAQSNNIIVWERSELIMKLGKT